MRLQEVLGHACTVCGIAVKENARPIPSRMHSYRPKQGSSQPEAKHQQKSGGADMDGIQPRVPRVGEVGYAK